jgi:hypothetical protein
MFWAMLIKPFLAFVLFGLALWLARLLMRWIPDGRIKRLLTRPIGKGSPRKWR